MLQQLIRFCQQTLCDVGKDTALSANREPKSRQKYHDFKVHAVCVTQPWSV